MTFSLLLLQYLPKNHVTPALVVCVFDCSCRDTDGGRSGTSGYTESNADRITSLTSREQSLRCQKVSCVIS